MTQKYTIHNQLTGMQEEAETFQQALILKNRIKQEYYSSIEGLFAISVLVKNEDNSWTQSLADENGNPFNIQTE